MKEFEIQNHGTFRPVKPFVLIVDDHEDSRELYAEALGAVLDADIVTAGDGVQALEVIAGRVPKVVVVDLAMPLMDGYELLRRIRENPSSANARVIALSGFTGQAERARAKDAGFDFFLGKPCSPKDLADTVTSCL